MAYLLIDDFSAGIDLRKSRVTAKPGTLRELKNAFVTAGGEIEKRKTFTSLGTLPAGFTHGLGFQNDTLRVFGLHDPGVVPPLPAYVTYQKLTVADGNTITRFLDVANYGTGLYAIAQFTDNSVRHFYNGTQIAAMNDKGTNARAHKSKMYVIDDETLRFSAVNDPSDTVGTGSGAIDVTTHDAGTAQLVGIEQYYGYLALFGRTAIQVWSMDPDPALNTLQQVLGNIGLVAPNAVARYGNGDVLFLSNTGIRSLRARDSSNAAVLNDIGSPVDALIAAKRAVLSKADVDRMQAIVDPLTGQFWLVWGDEVHVLAYYPNSKVTAWSTFKLPRTPDYAALANSRLVFRVGDELFIYGSTPLTGSPFDPNAGIGMNDTLYDDTEVEIVTSMLDLGQAATVKHWQGLDMACEGTWDVYVTPDYNQPDAWTKIATISKPTFGDGRIPLDMQSTHLAFKLVSRGTGYAKVSALAVHFAKGEGD